jgi:hypothetical protein
VKAKKALFASSASEGLNVGGKIGSSVFSEQPVNRMRVIKQRNKSK